MMGCKWVLGFHFFFLSILLVANKYTCLGAKNSTSSCHEQERQALLKFKDSVIDDFKVLSSWVDTECCSWKGVRCDGATGRVTGLHLRGNLGASFYNILEEDYYLQSDQVNANLAELRNLKYLDLSGNYFHGCQIPEFIGFFKHLTYLNLSHAGFTNIIPHHIGNLSNLRVLDLGTYPVLMHLLKADDMAWVSGLSSLEHLDLGYVELLQAKDIDMVMYMIPSLTYLSLRGCSLSNADLRLHLNSSKILPNIEHLDLSFNFFEGQLPHFFQNMTSLTFLDLSSYNLSLSWNSVNMLNMIPSLSELHLLGCGLHNAHFSPTVVNVSVHSSIQGLYLSKNSVEGSFPSILMNMTSLRVLDLSQNSVNSSIPVMPNLLKLDVSYNNFKHIELVGIWRQCHLKELSLSGNYFGEEMIGPSTNMSQCSQYNLEMLDSARNQISGSIPRAIGRLTNLRVLNLWSNRLTGSIPKAFQRLRSLEILDLSGNSLTGPIPTFLVKLTKLNLLMNQFSGSISESLGRLSGLTELVLDSNQLTGPIPVSLGRLGSLKKISVSSNFFNGTIPISIGQLTKLVHLDVSNNSLDGVVSEAHFANLSRLKILFTTYNHELVFNITHEWIPPFQLLTVNLGSCKILHGFPHWVRTQRKLSALVLSDAGLFGFLPTWLNKMKLMYLNLSQNKLNGSLKNLPFSEYLKYLHLRDNLFSDSIPQSLCRTTYLKFLDVSSNRLSGNIPECVENLQNLVVLALSSNGFSGVLPSSFGKGFSSLEWLRLNDNNFNGELPQDLGNLRSLRVLDLGNNKFSGNMPTSIWKNLLTLRVLRLHKNNLSGEIPQYLCKYSHLHILDIAHNGLTGSIPHCFGVFSGMIEARQEGILTRNTSYDTIYDIMDVDQVLKGSYLEYTKTMDLVFNIDLSSNKLTGEIPSEIVALTLLIGLNLSHNHLNGSIPDGIGNMKALNSLDFSDNQLNGMIPPSMAALNFLSYLNLSHNNLSGRIPTGKQLQTLNDPSMYAGNRNLCGAPLPNNCSNNENPPTTTSMNKYKDAGEPNNLWFYLDIMCGFATGFWGIIGVLFFKKQWRHKLFRTAEVTMDKVYVAVAVRVSKIK